MFGNIYLTSRKVISPERALELAKFYLEHAAKTEDRELALELCLDAGTALSRAKRSERRRLISSDSAEDQALCHGMMTAHNNHAQLLERLGITPKAQESIRKSEKWRPILSQLQGKACSGGVDQLSHLGKGADGEKTVTVADIAQIPPEIFACDVVQTISTTHLPDSDERIVNIQQFIHCLSLLPSQSLSVETLSKQELDWSQAVAKDPDEQERLRKLALDLIAAFINDEIKAEATVTEVVLLAPVLDREQFRTLLMTLANGIYQSALLEVHLLEGLAQVMQRAPTGSLDTDDLVTILNFLNERLNNVHPQSNQHTYQLTVTIAHVLDAMVNNQVNGLKREQLHEPLSAFLNGLKSNSDPYLVYYAAYAYQALQYIPDDETPLQAMLRRTTAVVKGVSSIVSAVKGLDLSGFMEGLSSIQSGLPSVTEVFEMGKTVYEGVSSLIESGQTFLECLEEGLSFARKTAWYPALRGADILLKQGQLAKFKVLICEAPCRRDPAFQWGICQRLGEIAANTSAMTTTTGTSWDVETRQGAVAFLGEIYKNDLEWGSHTHIKQWILTILIPLASLSGSGMRSAEVLLKELAEDGNAQKQALYQACLKGPSCEYPLTVELALPSSPTLLDRVQNKPDVEKSLRQLKKLRHKERGDSFYIPLQATKPNAAAQEARDDKDLFFLMDKAKEFLRSQQKIFLIQGDSGAGKSTFNRALESYLWDEYQKKEGRIPLSIHLPAIEKPERDLIAKRLRKADFTEPQIKELKDHREFVLICDGYDESQQTHNLYTSNRLNQPGEWVAQMVITCRSEYLGSDYRDRFQPADRDHQGQPDLFSEAVVAPFSENQVDDYIKYYVAVKAPLWRARDYQQTLRQVPSLQELVKNPFLLSLSLEVLPRMVDPGQELSASRITRVALYDQFVAQWLERSKKRLSDTLGPEDRKIFESLSDEGFVQNGINFLKQLAAEIYAHQAGNPVVEYSPFEDSGTWKEKFFSRENQKHLLREACPLTRTGSQYRFIHRSLLEYGLARAVFEPQDGSKSGAKRSTPIAVTQRRKSISSAFSFDNRDAIEEQDDDDDDDNDNVFGAAAVEPDINSPLVKRSFVAEPSVLNFLEERTRQEPRLKRQLFSYIEHSKRDKRWRIAAANAITVLIKAGLPFTNADLQGVRIPGADLSGGIFDSAQLQGADLRKVNFRSSWLRKADLTGSVMTAVQFGERPYLPEESGVIVGSYSPDDGKTCAVGLRDGTICIYSTSDWTKLHTLRGHTETVRTVAYSPSIQKGPQQIASDSDDGTVCVWNAESGELLHTFQGHKNRVSLLTYSPNGQQIASGCDDHTVRLWNVVSGRNTATREQETKETKALAHIFQGHTERVLGLAYAPRGDKIASCSADRSVRLWDVSSGQLLYTLEAGENSPLLEVHGVAFSPSGDQIASCSKDCKLNLWDTESGQLQHSLNYTESFFHLRFSPVEDHHQLAAACYDSVVVWDTKFGGEPRHTLRGHSLWINGLSYSPNGEHIATCSDDMTVRQWSTQSGQVTHIFTGHSDGVNHVAYSPISNLPLASFSNDKTLRLWDIQSSQSSSSQHSGHTGWVTKVISSASTGKQQQIASAGSDKTIRLWDAENGQLIRTLYGHTEGVRMIVYSPCGQKMVSCGNDGTVRLWDLGSGQLVHTFKYEISVYTVDYSPRGDYVIWGRRDGYLCVWDASLPSSWPLLLSAGGQGEESEMTLKYTIQGHQESVSCVKFSPSDDGYQFASSSDDKSIKLWDASTGELLYTLEGHRDIVLDVKYSPDGGKQVASRSADCTVRLWDPQEGQLLHILEHSGAISCMAYSVDGRRIALGGVKGSVTLWNTQTGALIGRLDGHVAMKRIYEMAFSPCDRYLASAGEDKTLRVWDVDAQSILGSRSLGQCLAVVEFNDQVRTLTWNTSAEKGVFLVTGCMDNSVRTWQIITEEEGKVRKTVVNDVEKQETGDGKKNIDPSSSGQCQCRLWWSSSQVMLNAEGAIIQDVKGLGGMQKALLKQHGAVGEAIAPIGFKEASKRLGAMAAVASNLKLLGKMERDKDKVQASIVPQKTTWMTKINAIDASVSEVIEDADRANGCRVACKVCNATHVISVEHSHA